MVKKITMLALLVSMALAIYMVEAQIPPLVPLPGVKLGLSSAITLFTLYMFGRREAAAVLFIRILLAAVFSGQMMSFLFSVSGGLFSFVVMALLYRRMPEEQMWVVSVFGALAHNAGQLAAAFLIMKTTAIAAYIPILIISAIATGAFTGFAAQLSYKRVKKLIKR